MNSLVVDNVAKTIRYNGLQVSNLIRPVLEINISTDAGQLLKTYQESNSSVATQSITLYPSYYTKNNRIVDVTPDIDNISAYTENRSDHPIITYTSTPEGIYIKATYDLVSSGSPLNSFHSYSISGQQLDDLQMCASQKENVYGAKTTTSNFNENATSGSSSDARVTTTNIIPLDNLNAIYTSLSGMDYDTVTLPLNILDNTLGIVAIYCIDNMQSYPTLTAEYDTDDTENATAGLCFYNCITESS